MPDQLAARLPLRGSISTEHRGDGRPRFHVHAGNLTPAEAITLSHLLRDVAHVERRESGVLVATRGPYRSRA